MILETASASYCKIGELFDISYTILPKNASKKVVKKLNSRDEAIKCFE